MCFLSAQKRISMNTLSIFSRNIFLCSGLIILAVQTLLIYWLLFRQRHSQKRRKYTRKSNPARVKPYEIPSENPQYLNETVDMGYIAAKVLKLMESRRLYMNPKLKEEELIKAVGTNRNYLSVAINNCFMLSFPNLCNYFRVREACAVYLSNPRITTESWMKKSGFSSKSSMSTAFVSFTEYTPSKWKKDVQLRMKRKETVSVSDYVKELKIV